MQRSVAQLKRTLRQLKRLETRIRFGDLPAAERPPLIWEAFFSTKLEDDASVKYPFHRLLHMDRQELKEVVEEYFYRVYFQKYKERGMTTAEMYDPTLLALLGLPPYASIEDIKTRFRELAKKHHPDRGGEHAKFIELMEVYERLTDGS